VDLRIPKIKVCKIDAYRHLEIIKPFYEDKKEKRSGSGRKIFNPEILPGYSKRF